MIMLFISLFMIYDKNLYGFLNAFVFLRDASSSVFLNDFVFLAALVQFHRAVCVHAPSR